MNAEGNVAVYILPVDEHFTLEVAAFRLPVSGATSRLPAPVFANLKGTHLGQK